MDPELVESSVVVLKDELQILLNLFADQPIVVDYPLFDLKLIQAKISGDGYRLRVLSDEDDFGRLYEDYGTYVSELPSFDDIRYCMLLSGIIQYDNLDKFKDMLRLYERMDKIVYFALDTNMLYQGFPSQATYMKNPRYLVVDTVYNEIESSVNYKYKPFHIHQMQECAFYQPELLENLENRKMKKARKAAHVAMKEYHFIREHVQEIKSELPSTTHSEMNDRVIVNALRRFDEENSYAYPVFLTADTNASNLCEGKGPDCFHFTYPSSLDAKECTSDQLVKLVYWLAIVNGFIKCNSVIICGEFGHKGRDDDSLKLMFQDRKLFETFMRELGICKRLMALDIAR
ncbi:hypothetical protein [Methanomethylovorans sp.]|uniref:hypothetical protein n=1 Tax=Methanomethylovorans sp. TaxID=2758717 RepID=UPI00351C5A41